VAESVSRHLKLKSNPHIDDPDVDWSNSWVINLLGKKMLR
jgi:hypothetical protein